MIQQLSFSFQLQKALLHTCSFFLHFHPNARISTQVEAISLPSTLKFKNLLQFYGLGVREWKGGITLKWKSYKNQVTVCKIVIQVSLFFPHKEVSLRAS